MAYLRRSIGTVTGRTFDSPVLTTPALGTPSAGVMTNMTGAVEASLVNDAVTLAKMVAGTDGNIISYDASGDPVAIATGSDGEVLTSTGAGSPPAFEAAGGGATSGMISNVYKFSDVSSGTQTNTGTTTKYVAQDANSFAGVSGRHYVISGVQPCSPRGDGSTSNVGRFQTMRLYYGTTDRSIGDTTLDTSIFGENILIGRNISAASTNTALGLLLFTYIAYFTAGSTATHYVYTVVSTFSGSTSRAYNDADNPHKTIVFEVMP